MFCLCMYTALQVNNPPSLLLFTQVKMICKYRNLVSHHHRVYPSKTGSDTQKSVRYLYSSENIYVFESVQ